jgi:pimeloyl-ACP methyl ester carboxylesterase
MTEHRIATNDIELRVLDLGDGPPVILCHGFPELAYSWRHQITELANAGYRVIAPDMRGYGQSSVPAAVEAYDVLTVGLDVVGILDELDIPHAVLIGHDWGATVCWTLALTHPERVSAVAGLSVPFFPRSPVPPMQILRERLGDDWYQNWFQQVGPADRAMASQVARTVTATEEWTEEWANRAIDSPPPSASWLTERDLAVFVTALTRTGFSGGLNYYRNIDRNWRLTAHLDGKLIEQPSLFITGGDDIVRRFLPGTRMDGHMADLRGFVVLDGAGHWIQQERPDEVNRELIRFLASLPRDQL